MERLIHPKLETCAYYDRNVELTREDCDLLTKIVLEFVAIPDRTFICRITGGANTLFEELRPLLENNLDYRIYSDDDGFYITPID